MGFKSYGISAILILGLVIPAYAGDGVPVTSISTLRTSATPSGPYVIGGNTISYGVGDNVEMTSVNVGALNLTRSAVSKPIITINRIDNINVTGERLTLFYPGLASGTDVNIEGDETTSMEQAMNDDYITSAGLDVFLNVDSGVEKANNIERIDFIVPNGINLPNTPALLNEVGTVANEKHGNNTYKIAMITGLDSFGQPASYAPLKLVQGNVDYGNIGRPQNGSGTLLNNLYLRNGASPVGGGGNGPVAYIRGDTNFIGMSFLSFSALGATPGQTVYGYSLFAQDVFDSNDLTGLTDIPTNSGSGNGGDIYGGTFAIFSSIAAEAETSQGGAELTGVKTVEVYDPSNVGIYAIPGNDVIYEISVTNEGSRSPDNNSMLIIDKLPQDITFYHDDIDDGGPETTPIAFIDNSSGLGFNYGSDVRYSNSLTSPVNYTDCAYSPSVAGYDAAITHLCVRPSGTMNHGTPNPGFSIKFRARIN